MSYPRTSRPADAYHAGAVSIEPVSRRSSQWLHDMHRNALRLRREQPARADYWRGRADAIRAELNARGQKPEPQEVDR